MRKSDPEVSIVSVHGQNSDLNSVLTVQVTGLGPILVFPWIQPFGCDASSSLGRVYSRQATVLNCDNSSVFRHEILCILNNTQKSCIQTKFAQFVLL